MHNSTANADSSPTSTDRDGQSDGEKGQSAGAVNAPPAEEDYPEGGLRGWLAVFGSAATMFATFGYLTGFG